LIYGGMFTGAMGGGVAMLSLTPLAKEMHECGKMSNIEHSLDELSKWKTRKGTVPFQRLSRIEYSVNVNGILLKKTKRQHRALIKREYLFKAMDSQNIICLDSEFSEIIIPLTDITKEEINRLRIDTDLAQQEGRDVNIVAIETHYQNDGVSLKSISCKNQESGFYL